jgi:hypothetical protein
MKPGIELVVVPPGLEGGVEALPELEVEHPKRRRSTASRSCGERANRMK